MGGSNPRPPPKGVDLSNFGKINKTGPIFMGPSSVWAGKKGSAKRDSTPTMVNLRSNAFTLGRGVADMHDTSSKPSQPLTNKMNIDLGTPKPQRRKFQAPPRSKPVGVEDEIIGGSQDHPAGEGDNDTPPAMSKVESNKRIAEDTKELSSAVRSADAGRYFTKFPSEHHHRLVNKGDSKAAESREAGGKLVADVPGRAVEKIPRSISVFKERSIPDADLLDDAPTDAPSQGSTDHPGDDAPATSRFSFLPLFSIFS